MGDEENVSIVPVGDFSFGRVIEDNFYAFPATYKYKLKEYIAFYRVSPTSAVTHITRIGDVIRDGDVGTKYRFMTFGDRLDERAVVLGLKDLREWGKPIPYGDTPIQKSTYTTMKRIERIDEVADL